MLDTYRKAKGCWSSYEKQFLELMSQRRIETELQKDVIDGVASFVAKRSPSIATADLSLNT